jgi:hypothetical protein
MVRYGFNIRTKTGQRVDNIQILAASVSDAERRLRQMYRECEIIERREQSVPRRVDPADLQYQAAAPASCRRAAKPARSNHIARDRVRRERNRGIAGAPDADRAHGDRGRLTNCPRADRKRSADIWPKCWRSLLRRRREGFA